VTNVLLECCRSIESTELLVLRSPRDSGINWFGVMFLLCCCARYDEGVEVIDREQIDANNSFEP
jgi:hypothetical protein